MKVWQLCKMYSALYYMSAISMSSPQQLTFYLKLPTKAHETKMHLNALNLFPDTGVYPEAVISVGSAKYNDSFVAFGGFNPNNGGLSTKVHL